MIELTPTEIVSATDTEVVLERAFPMALALSEQAHSITPGEAHNIADSLDQAAERLLSVADRLRETADKVADGTVAAERADGQ